MDADGLPNEWLEAFERDRSGESTLPDPLPERRLARLLAAFVVGGLVFMALPGTLLGLYNLIGISSRRELAALSAPWIQAHGHAQFFGWIGSFIIGISLYTLPKFRGSRSRSIPLAWAMWAMWVAGVALRWAAGLQLEVHVWEFRASATLELVVAGLLLWQVSARGPKHRRGQPWEAPIFGGFAALAAVLTWQLRLSMLPLATSAVPAGADRTLISLAIWAFAFPVVAGYCAKFFPGLLGAPPSHTNGMRIATAIALAASAAFVADTPLWAAAATFAGVAVAAWSVRVFQRPAGRPKTSGVYGRYPLFARIAWGWLLVAALLGFGAQRPGMLGASRHAFTVGFLATLVFSLGPRILPSFLNSRELRSPQLMRASLLLITAGCALRVVSEPLAYMGISGAAWKALPVSGFVETIAVLAFGLNIAASLATPVPSWFGRKQVSDRMSVYWLVSSYPETREILIESGLATLARVRRIPHSLSLREAAVADGASREALVARLGDFFESRLPRSLRQPRRTSESIRSTNR